MARSRKLRRRVRRKAPPVRRGGSDLIVGGAKDPAEGAADRLAARALAGGVKSGGTAAAPAPALRRAAPATSLAPGSAAAAAPKQAANLVTSLGSGRSLNAGERSYFEPRMNADLSSVRVHEGSRADQATRALDADAFAHGPDIAFARGTRSRETMAHELAHVVQDRQPRLRRKIVTDYKFTRKQNLAALLRVNYGVKGIRRKKNIFSKKRALTGASLGKEMVSAMLASGREFRLIGSSLAASMSSLRKHLMARRGVVQLAKDVRIEFSTKKDSFADGVLKYVYDEAWRVTMAKVRKKERISGKRMPDADVTDIYFAEISEAMQRNADTPRFKKAIDIIRKKSAQYDIRKALSGSAGAKPFVAACLSATETVMMGGGGQLYYDDLPKLKDKKEMIASHKRDWVPGDWGYIKNLSKKPKAGLEGENIIYLGNKLFWAHFGNIKKPVTYEQMFAKVKAWNKKAGASHDTQRSYPKIGLK